MTKDMNELNNKNIKVNKDGTISPIDPSKPSRYSTKPELTFEPTDTSLEGIIRAILLDMEWCHAVKTESLEKATQTIQALITEQVRLGRIDELKKMVKEWGYGEYPSNDPRHGLDWEGWADYRTAQLDALLNTKEENDE